MTPDVSIVIVSWNTWEDLEACILSIQASRFAGTYEVIVVDNASTDGSAASLGARYPWVKTIQNAENCGFPKANNQALDVARGEFLLYLNPDTELCQDTLGACVQFMRATPACGLMGCKVRYPDGRVQFECARSLPSLAAMVWESVYLHMLFPAHPQFSRRLIGNWDHDSSRVVPCLIGAFMLGRTDLLRRLGGMDESVFMFFEDVDLCYRVALSGFEVHYLSDVSIVHKSGRAQRKAPRLLTAEKLDAHLAFFLKHGTRWSAFACWAVLSWQGVFRLAVSLPLLVLARACPPLSGRLGKAHTPAPHLATLRWAAEVVTGRLRHVRPSIQPHRLAKAASRPSAEGRVR